MPGRTPRRYVAAFEHSELSFLKQKKKQSKIYKILLLIASLVLHFISLFSCFDGGK